MFPWFCFISRTVHRDRSWLIKKGPQPTINKMSLARQNLQQYNYDAWQHVPHICSISLGENFFCTFSARMKTGLEGQRRAAWFRSRRNLFRHQFDVLISSASQTSFKVVSSNLIKISGWRDVMKPWMSVNCRTAVKHAIAVLMTPIHDIYDTH